MKQTIKTLVEKRDQVSKQLAKIENAIKALQEVCPHEKMEYIGHDSHYNYEKCIECGYVDDRC